MRPMPSMILSRRAKIALTVVALVVVLLILLVKLSGVYLNFLWYDSLHAHRVYSTMLWTRVSLFFIFGVLMAVLIGGNLVVAYLLRPPFRPMSPEQQNLQNYVLMLEPRRKWILGGIVALTLLSAGASAQGDWATWQLWLHGSSFGIPDPQFGRDISFYAWDYPVYRNLLGWGFTAVLVSIILSVGVHYLTGAIRFQTPGPKMTLAARRHLTVLVFAFMVLKAIAYWLDRYGLVFSSRSKFTGASYTDVHSVLPARTILFWIAIVLALGVLASIWLRSVLLPGIGFAVLLILSILISGIYPAIVQQVTVKPNASDKEAPYILRNIKATRAAYDIESRGARNPFGTVTYQDYPATQTPNPAAVTTKNTTVDNIRILDPNIISPTFIAQQKIGLPYTFSPILDVDRYKLASTTHDYIVAVREQAPGSNLSGSQDNWINQHTVYTHGYGFVAAQADTDVTNGGRFAYTEGEIPPSGPLTIKKPEVYYGELGNDYSIVGAEGTPREFNGNNDPNVTYTGKGGVPLRSPLTKLALAVKYKQTNFVLNDAVSAPGAKIIFDRNPKTMVEKVAPFLTVDGDPYPFVDQSTGHIMWMLDGYTTMANYPYSERQSLSQLTQTSLQPGQKDRQINYIRNSVKATVDAYDGTVRLYAWNSHDPVLKTWMRIFPGLVQPRGAMPASVLTHVRYPQDLFNVQRGLLAQYHISNPVAAYNGKGKWAVPVDPFAAGDEQQPAYYVLANPPGQTSNTPEFQLTTPMVVNNATNLAAYMSVNSDPQHYGQITVLKVPPSATVQGPNQIANVFKSNSTISKDITLLSTGQSQVLHGNLLTLPLGDSFLYVEPLYVQATGSAGSYPTLQRVLVTYGDNVGYGQTLQAALDDIRLRRGTGASLTTLGQTTGNGGTSTTPAPSNTSTTPPPPATSSGSATHAPPPAQTQPGILAQLNTVNDKLNAAKAQSPPDLVEIARLEQQEQQLVQQLLASASASRTGSSGR